MLHIIYLKELQERVLFKIMKVGSGDGRAEMWEAACWLLHMPHISSSRDQAIEPGNRWHLQLSIRKYSPALVHIIYLGSGKAVATK